MQNSKVLCLKAAFLLSVFFLLLLSKDAAALGISPARVIQDFSPNMEGEIDFCIINNENKEIPVDIYVKGDLAQYITLKDPSFDLRPSSTVVCTKIYYKLPEELVPGHHDTRIGAVESVASRGIEGTGIAARVGVEMQWWIEAPFPGKYVLGLISAPEMSFVGKPVPIVVGLKNSGKEDSKVKAIVDVLSAQYEQLARKEFPEELLRVAEAKEYTYQWPGSSIAGEYRAKLTYFYEGLAKETDRVFVVGDLYVRINEILTPKINKSGIQPIPIAVQSFWNQRIDNLYAEVTLEKDGKVVASGLKSDVLTLQPLSKAKITAFWDTTDAELGVYNVTVKAFYSNRTTGNVFQIELVKKSFFGNRTTMLLLFLIVDVIIVLALALAVIYYLKQKKKR